MAIDRNKISKLAESYMAAGRVDRAIEEFLKLLEDRPDDNMLNRVGDAYLQAGKASEALEMFKKAGAGYERGGFNAKATAVFKKAHRVAPEDVDIAVRLADLYRQTNMIKEAIQIHIEVAEICTRKGLIKRALEEFAQVVDLDPKNLKNKVKLADLYNKEGMKDKAANIYLEVAEALALEQMHAEARQLLERTKAMVTIPQVFLTQSRLCVIEKDLAGAAEHLREGLGLNPRSPELLDALAEVELKARAPEKALEALAQVPQLPEKSLHLCERALRDLSKAGQAAAGLELFRPIGREFARRGMGEAAAKAIRAALHGAMTAEAWVQLGEIAHQGGNRPEEVECLRHALAEAEASGDRELAEATARKLQEMGVRQEDVSAPFAPAAPALRPQPEPEPSPTDSIDVSQEVLRRMQIQKLQRDAAAFRQSRYMDSALDTYARILDLEPGNLDAINAIADIHRSTGMLTKVQLHYVKTAERIAPLGLRALAVELLDRAETMFPGSTRLYRRTLGLMEPVSAPAAPDTHALEGRAPAPLEDLPLIPLDLELQTWSGEAPPPARAPIAAGPGAGAPEPGATEILPLETLPLGIPEAAVDLPEIQSSELSDYEWAEVSGLLGEPGPVVTGELPALELEAGAEAPLAAFAPVEGGDDLAAVLSDIDFQLDYGSPEEALIEIEAASARHPGHPELAQRKDQAEAALRRMGHEARPEAPPVAGAPAFFDLTDVLGEALLEPGEGEEMHDATDLMGKIQSVDELFNAFRAGVEQQVQGDDYDTHYNLGIAYKEMMLLEPAMEEFKRAMLDPERTMECCSMLAICEQTQGNLEGAVQWLLQGIDAPGFPPEDSVGLRYDLGSLLLSMDRRAEAQEQFLRVYGLDPDYRDVGKLVG
jgi:tetratricopeptide (TPR) repeat protein